MEERAPTSPPGSWPLSDVIDEAMADDNAGQEAPESPLEQRYERKTLKGKAQEVKRVGILPPEIIEQ